MGVKILNYVLMFFIYSMVGWTVESTYRSLGETYRARKTTKEKKIINSGFLYGPMCPIYGAGALVFEILLTPFKNHWWAVILLGMVFADIVEYVALDEGYLDVTHTADKFGGARAIACKIKKRTKAEVGLTCSVGIGYSMTSAKMASEEKKPDGFFEIPTAGFEVGEEVIVYVPFSAIELTDDEEDGVIGANVAQSLYKGTYYQVQVITDSGEEFYIDTADEWDMNDRVGIKIDPTKVTVEAYVPQEESDDEEE